MSATSMMGLAVVLFSAILFVNLKYGLVGGGGVATRRDEWPISYWIGVACNAVGLTLSISVFIYLVFFKK